MPPKNNITLGPGRLFFNAPEGPQPLGSIYEAEILEETEEAEEPWPKENPYIKQTDGATFSADVTKAIKAVGTVAAKMTETFGILWTLVKRVYGIYAVYPNKRVKHLALHAKKRRTRKKNMRRIGRELMKEAKKRNDRT